MRYTSKYGYKKFACLSGRLPEAKCKIPVLLCVLIAVLITAVSCSNNSSSISLSTPYFPVQKPGMNRMDALMENVKLEMDDNGCLRAEGYLLIWPHGYSVRTEGEEVQIINDNGQVVACVGDKINIGGGEMAVPEEEAREHIEKNIIRQKLPDGCLGPYWIVSEVINSDINTGLEEAVTEEASTSNSAENQQQEETGKESGDEVTELFFAEDYARIHGVTVDEARRRLRLQDIAGKLGEELTINEADTLAGLWIEHIPEFKVVILFTRDAEDIIKPYLQKYEELSSVIEVGKAKYSLIELGDILEEVSSSIESIGIPVALEIDVYNNCVKVYIAEEDRPQFDRATLEGKLMLPECVEVITVSSLEKPED